MITIIYPYRDRESERVKRSLDSLKEQTNSDFEVLLVDYGSNLSCASIIKDLISNYKFAKYLYNYSGFQPWSRAKAINIGLKKTTTEYIFTADVDMIFSPNFVSRLHELKNPFKAYYFKVGFLNEKESKANKKFENYLIDFSTEIGAQGLSLFYLNSLKEITGYDEFLHFWGAEDIDVHNRLEKNQTESIFYSEEILMLHQWHASYRKSEKKVLTTDLQLTDVVKMNQQKLLANTRSKEIKINNLNWGAGFLENDFENLKNYGQEKLMFNKKEVVTHFLFCELPNFKNGILNIHFVKDPFQTSLKYRLKKFLGKNVPKYYSLKEINDLLLLHIISFYHTHPYFYEVSNDLNSITFKIKK
ncbi:putative glycosyl transferase [Flavobacterium sp. ACN2]|jgi:glycosyltransferase involved in cell wall biosynthesis|uniref:glycosyltransferase family 2 protein n=1 Tax=Flavobacterium sp. ACN2 TaxID=1975676 RepID=UPI000BB33665|nr:glycosyltransferase family 2 protein [Flavobacterium sp. ACN2]PBI89463.1 putative glycosyl transferase [Flavobacterium sp. ACN2]